MIFFLLLLDLVCQFRKIFNFFVSFRRKSSKNSSVKGHHFLFFKAKLREETINNISKGNSIFLT